MKALFAALLIAGLTPALALAQAEPTTRAPQAGDAAKLAGLIVPDAQMPTLIATGFRRGFATSIAANPTAKALYDANPGMEDFVVQRVSDTLGRLAAADLPALREQLAGIVHDEMEPDEIVDTLTFFESPTGTKMRARVVAAMQQQAPASAEEGQKAAAAAAIADLTPEDYPALTAFARSSAAKKMQLVNPKIMAASQAWGLQVGSANAAKLKATREAAEAEFLAKGKAK